jgi:putative Ca2+/H+ antiporter (TMEM165/GDT1 family)
MPALLTSTLVVALAEVGDKTQLLSLVLAARFRRPVPIICGILVATLANHALAAWAGGWIASSLDPSLLQWLLALSFFAMALWALMPDEPGDVRAARRTGVFTAALVAFFLAEMGDKTQLATVALAARYDALEAVVLGTTLGMMLANVPVVLFGDRIVERLPLKLVRWLAACLFLGLGSLVAVRGI